MVVFGKRFVRYVDCVILVFCQLTVLCCTMHSVYPLQPASPEVCACPAVMGPNGMGTSLTFEREALS